MKDLEKAFSACLQEVEKAGIRPGKIVAVKVNTRAKKRWGQCKKTPAGFEISISDRLLEEGVDQVHLKSVLVHEILHTVPGCMDHGPKWKSLAKKMNQAYGYAIRRTTDPESFGLQPDPEPEPRYIIRCEKCGKSWTYARMCKTVKRVAAYDLRHQGCGGRLHAFKQLEFTLQVQQP